MGGFTMQMQNTCQQCGGKGSTSNNNCPKCRGKKTVPSDQTLKINIEKGM